MDLAAIRAEFPIAEEWTFLDNAGAIPLPRFVTGALQEFIARYYSQGITDHWPLLQETVRDGRELFARLIGARSEEVALVTSTSEGMNIVANMVDFQPGDNIVVTDLEFPANQFPWLNLERKGVRVRVAPVLGAVSPLDALAHQVDERTRVVAVSHVAFPTGLKLGLAAVAALAHGHGAYLAVDAVQSAGVVPLDVHAAGVDFLACSGFKWLLSPSGTGAFFCRQELLERYEPAYVSWFSVENPYNFVPGNRFVLAEDARRFMISGNINLIGFQGFRAGLRFIHQVGVQAIHERVMALRDRILDRVAALGLPLVSPQDRSQLAQIVNFRVPAPERLLETFRHEHIYAVQRVGGIRLSPYIYNTEAELDRVLDLVADDLKEA